MSSHRRTLFAAIAFASLCATGPAAEADPGRIVGTWLDHTGRGAVELTRCGTALCGRIVWMKDPLDQTGKPWKDGYNPDPARRNQTVCGLQIIGDAKPQSDGSFDQGWIYNPEDGGRYTVEVRLVSPNVLRVHGYMGMKFLGETLVWKRASQPLSTCVA